MKKFIPFVIVMLAANFKKADSQKVYFQTDKLKYNATDSIKIKTTNKSTESLVYVIGLEIKIANKWEEIEGDIVNRVPKAEKWMVLKKNENITNSIVLPSYVVRNVKKNNANLRFRLKYGLNVHTYNLIYSKTIIIR